MNGTGSPPSLSKVHPTRLEMLGPVRNSLEENGEHNARFVESKKAYLPGPQGPVIDDAEILQLDPSGVNEHKGGPAKTSPTKPKSPPLSPTTKPKNKFKAAAGGLVASSVATKGLKSLADDAKRTSAFGHQDGPLWESNPSPYIIPVDSPFKTKWDMSQLLVLAYVALVVPVRVCFSLDTYGAEFVIECLVDLYFYVDIAINFVSAIKIEKGVEVIIVDDFKSIATSYLKGWFVLDALACLPIDYITRANQGTLGCSFTSCPMDSDDGDGSGNALKLFKILRTFRLMKLVRLTRIKRILKRYEDQLVYWQHVLVFVKVFGVVFIVSHWLGCMYGAVYDWGTYPDDQSPEPNIYEKWVACFYWAVQTTTTVGYGDLTSNTIQGQLTSAFAMTMGGVVFSWFMSTIMTLLNPDPAAVQQQETMQYVVSYLRQNSLPVTTAARVLAYFRKNNDFSFDETKMLHSLPVSLRQEIFNYLYTDSICNAPVIKDQDERFISELCLAVKPVVYDEYDMIYQEGDTAEEMYILVSGKVSIMHNVDRKHILHSVLVDTSDIDTNAVTTYEDPGAYFGEEALFGVEHRHEYVCCRHTCKLLSLPVSAMCPLLEDLYPMAREDMLKLFCSKLQSFGKPAAVKQCLKAMKLQHLGDSSSPEGKLKRNWRAILEHGKGGQGEDSNLADSDWKEGRKSVSFTRSSGAGNARGTGAEMEKILTMMNNMQAEMRQLQASVAKEIGELKQSIQASDVKMAGMYPGESPPRDDTRVVGLTPPPGPPSNLVLR